VAGPRRPAAEIAETLYLHQGTWASAKSRYWLLLGASGVIATGGVLVNSTPAVIGAMIIAPMGVPLLGTAFGLARREPMQAVRSLLAASAGAALVVGVGALLAELLPSITAFADNPQVVDRASPELADLVVAAATAVVGALAIARRDIGDVLPGVAVAISLVPPLAVVGAAVGQGQGSIARGALLLFLTNAIALVAVGSAAFAVLGYARRTESAVLASRPRWIGRAAVALTVGVVAIPLVVDTTYEVRLAHQEDAVRHAASQWAATVAGVTVDGVTREGWTYVIDIGGSDQTLSFDGLLAALDGAVPAGTRVVVDQHYGSRMPVGVVP
jgi:uncharacterized hydrophobic protein (TIGR00271 family)